MTGNQRIGNVGLALDYTMKEYNRLEYMPSDHRQKL